jgi:DNA-binding NarL/FixJ family response regulator
MGVTTIVLADDHPVVRQGLRALLEAEEDLRVVGEASDGLEAVRLVERLKPNVLVTDLMMPGLSGMEVTRQARDLSPGTRSVVLSMHASEAYVLEALKYGAAAYVLKEATATELVYAVREVAAGRRYLSAPLTTRVLDAYVQKVQDAAGDPHETLTTREREVLHLAAEGRTSAEIARRLFLSPRTVETHRAAMMRKLGLRTQTDLVRYAIRRGMLPPDS